jgi:hypothetical protein
MSPTIQPRFGEGGFPIGRLILDRAKALGLSRTDLVRRFGYRGLTGGHAALSDFLLTGITPPFIQEKLADALEVDQELLDAVLVATARQLHDEARSQMLAREDAYRAAFRPHLQVATERRVPSPIFVAALLGTARLRIVPIPDAAFETTEEKRDRTVKTTIIEHYREHRGHVPAFGRITDYMLVVLPGYGGVDFGLPFDLSGDPAGPMRKIPRLPEAMLGVKRADGRLTGLLKGTPIEVMQVESGHPTRRGATDA